MRSTLLLLPGLFLAMACGAGDSSGNATDAVDESDRVSRDASDNSTPRPPADIAGTYSVTGTNPDGTAYEGALTVTTRGSVYQFSWATGNDYEGVGVIDGDAVAVGWGGPECGAVLYRIGNDGSLSGRWALYENESAGSETAGRASDGDGLVGSYVVNGTNPDGTNYTGSLNIAAAGDSYQLAWEAGGTTVGQGIVMDEMLGSSYGSESCGVAVYRARGGTLDGTWTTYGAGEVGTERAVRG